MAKFSRPAREAIDFSVAPIIVKVGQPAQTYHANEAVLHASSPFFDKALGAEWKEGQQRTVKLPDCDAPSFNLWLNWLLTGKLSVDDEEKDVDPRKMGFFWRSAVQAYVLGDKLLAVDFKDAISDALAEAFRKCQAGTLWVTGKVTRRYLYENTVPGASLRRLLVRQLHILASVHTAVSVQDHPALVHEVMVALATSTRPSAEQYTTEVAACRYHEHEPEAENCHRDKRR